MGLILITFAIIVFAWFIYRWNNRAFESLAYKIPSNRFHTFLGFGKIFTGNDMITYMYEYGNKYGPNSVLWVGPYPTLLTSDPQTLRDILTSRNCVNKPPLFYKGFSLTVGNGLINELEPNWSNHRKLLNKAFSPGNLSSFVPLFNKEINIAIQQIQNSLEKSEDVDMFSLFGILTMKIATQTTLKRDLDKTDYDTNVMFKNSHLVLKLIATICKNVFFNVSWIRKLAAISIHKKHIQALKMLDRLINESVAILETNDTTDPSHLPEINSALDYVINGVLPQAEAVSHMWHLFGGGFETTSTTLFMVVSMLAMHPEYQQKAYEEVINVLPDDDSDITLEQLNKLTYLEMVVNETLRVCPAIPLTFRSVSNEDITLSNGLTLPVGQIVCIDIYRLHRCKEIWGPNANDFNPENFLPSNINSRHPFGFMPFSKGHRICIGWKYALISLKIVLTKLIKTYKFTTDFRYEDLLFDNHVTLALMKKPQLYLEQRKVQ